MSKRNFILLIIIIIIVLGVIFGILYFNQGTTNGGNSTGTNFISIFNPFPSSKTKPPIVTPPVDTTTGQTSDNGTGGVIAIVKLKKVSSMPIAGFTVFSKERLKDIVIPIPVDITPPSINSTNPSQVSSGSSTTPTTTPVISTTKKIVTPTKPLTEFAPALRYVARADGNIYETFADKLQETKFSTTIIPKVYEAFFGNKGDSVVMRYLKTGTEKIETFFGNLPKELLGVTPTTTNEVKGSFLPENITDLSISGDSLNIFYLFNVGNTMVGTTMNLTTNKKVQIFTSPFTEWLPDWPTNKIITLTTKPSSGIPGYTYTIDPTTTSNNLTQLLGNINGLTTKTSPNGKLVLYNNDSLSLNIYHTDTKVSSSIGINTIPEKCVWSSLSDVVYCSVPKIITNANYPDSWYQGEVSFSDQIWKIDVKTGNLTMVLDPSTVSGGEDIDGIKLALDDSGNYLFFVNKKDSFLWEFSLK